jgi:hypothetical protein
MSKQNTDIVKENTENSDSVKEKNDFVKENVALYDLLLGPPDPAEEKARYMDACMRGDTDQILDWIEMGIPNPGEGVEMLAKYGHKELSFMFLEMFHTDIPNIGMHMIFNACGGGHFELAEEIRTIISKIQNSNSLLMTDETFAHICMSQMEYDAWLEKYNGSGDHRGGLSTPPYNLLTDYIYVGGFMRACLNGDLDGAIMMYELCKNMDLKTFNPPGHKSIWIRIHEFSSVANLGLCFGAGNKHLNIVDAMLDRGANDLERAATDAAFVGCQEIVDKLINKISITRKIYISAAASGNIALLDKLRLCLQPKLRNYEMDFYNAAAFQTACQYGKISMVFHLLDIKAFDVDIGIEIALQGGYHRLAYYLTRFVSPWRAQSIANLVISSAKTSYWANEIKIWAISVAKEPLKTVTMTNYDYIQLAKKDCNFVLDKVYFRFAKTLLARQRALMMEKTPLPTDIINLIMRY